MYKRQVFTTRAWSATASLLIAFFVTFAPLPWLDHKAVAFGRVVKGCGALRALNKLETSNERPVENVIIANCNVVNLVDGFGLGHGGGM